MARKQKKKTLLPDVKYTDIKVNIVVNKKHNDSYDSSNENHRNNMKTYMKLPNIYKNDYAYNKQNLKNESKFYNSNEFKNAIKHNISNNSIEMQKTQYVNPKQNMIKKMHDLKKAYVSPYSMRVMQNHIKS